MNSDDPAHDAAGPGGATAGPGGPSAAAAGPTASAADPSGAGTGGSDGGTGSGAAAGGAAAGGAAPGGAAPDGAAAGGAAAGGAAGGADGPEADERAARKREHAVRGTLAAALILEGITVLFVPQTIAAIGDDGLGGRRLAVLLVLAAALFVAAGIQRRPAGPLLGTVLQVAVILTGLMVGVMWFLGLLFAAVWGFLLWVRQEVGRAAARAGTGSPRA
jgi:Protein of unknown function (DUF4233)